MHAADVHGLNLLIDNDSTVYSDVGGEIGTAIYDAWLGSRIDDLPILTEAVRLLDIEVSNDDRARHPGPFPAMVWFFSSLSGNENFLLYKSELIRPWPPSS